MAGDEIEHGRNGPGANMAGEHEVATQRSGMDRRTMLKAAVATGAATAVWVAPRIETLGFAPAGALGTPCDILSKASDDKNSNLGTAYCSRVGTFDCCNHSFGNSGGQLDRWTFEGPVPGCNSLVVALVPLDCEPARGGTPPNPQDPSLARMGLVILSKDGTCPCTIKEGVLLQSSGRVERKTMNNGPMTCDYTGAVAGSGVDISLRCNDPVLLAVGSDARLAVRITCVSDTGDCVVVA